MTGAQLYLAIGVPIVSNALIFTLMLDHQAVQWSEPDGGSFELAVVENQRLIVWWITPPSASEDRGSALP